MIKLDDNLLQELGLGVLSPDDKKKMLAHIYETLEMRVGMELAKQMSDAQLNEFEEFINRNDEAGAMQWLETNFPNYKEVVAAEFEKLKLEIKQVAPQIIASNQQAAAAAAQPQAMPDPAGGPHGQPFATQQTHPGYAQPQGGYQQPAATPYPPQGSQGGQGYSQPTHPRQPQSPFTPDDNDFGV